MRSVIHDEIPAHALTVPCRVILFGTRQIVKGRKTRDVGVAWQGWNADPRMEARMARLPGSGSFYWPMALHAFQWAEQVMRDDPSIHQFAVETVSGVPIARAWR